MGLRSMLKACNRLGGIYCAPGVLTGLLFRLFCVPTQRLLPRMQHILVIRFWELMRCNTAAAERAPICYLSTLQRVKKLSVGPRDKSFRKATFLVVSYFSGKQYECMNDNVPLCGIDLIIAKHFDGLYKVICYDRLPSPARRLYNKVSMTGIVYGLNFCSAAKGDVVWR